MKHTPEELRRLRESLCKHIFQEWQTVTNARVKRYLIKDVMQVANADIFASGQFFRWDGKPRRGYQVSAKGEAKDPERSVEESRRRAKSKVMDIALCNKFQYMFTWTLDKKLVDRTDPDAVYEKARAFLSNATQRKGFSYILIPEYHKLKPGEDKPGIHFHGLCNIGSVKIVRAMKRHRPRVDKSGRPVFNMTDWSFGWSTVVPLDGEYERAVNYITKYITKQDTKILGKWYLSSRALKKAPDIIPLDRVDYNAFRNDEKIIEKEQTVISVFRDIKIIQEVL